MEELSLENISFDIDPFNVDMNEESKEEVNDKTKEITEEINEDDLFSESVGNEESIDESGKEDPIKNNDKDSSNFYSSIAKALKEDGVLPNLIYEEISTSEDFAKAIEESVSSQLEDRQKRIEEALKANVNVSDIQKYENVIDYLDSITEESLLNENDEGENLRKQIIYQDFINRGFSKERAEKEVKKSLDSGNDIEDAKEALSSNKEYFKNTYTEIIKKGKEEEQKLEEQKKSFFNDLKTSILEEEKFLNKISIDKNTKNKIIDNISKPIYKDKDTGVSYTALGKYEKENKADYLKIVGTLFTLTNGFTDINSLFKDGVKKELNSKLKELEQTLNTSKRSNNGDLTFVTGLNDDPESSISYDLDL